jgi:hypothetical protein
MIRNGCSPRSHVCTPRPTLTGHQSFDTLKANSGGYPVVGHRLILAALRKWHTRLATVATGGARGSGLRGWGHPSTL